MDKFNPEDELKPDASDRRPVRSRRPAAANKVPVPRQRMMMGVGILVLILLVIGIGSALKRNDKSNSAENNSAAGVTGTQAGSGKNIDLTGSASTSQNLDNASSTAPPIVNDKSSTSNSITPGNDSTPQQLSPSSVATTPTESKSQPALENQHRVELSGNLNNAFNQQQNQVDHVASVAQSNDTETLPTASATVAEGVRPPPKTLAPIRQSPTVKPLTERTKHQKPKSESAHKTKNKEQRFSGAAPSGQYTLQLSGASREDSLHAWAKKQNLSRYHIDKTTRNGQPWYVLITGAYATPTEARRAIASLPAGVRAQNPWVKPLNQVKK